MLHKVGHHAGNTSKRQGLLEFPCDASHHGKGAFNIEQEKIGSLRLQTLLTYDLASL